MTVFGFGKRKEEWQTMSCGHRAIQITLAVRGSKGILLWRAPAREEIAAAEAREITRNRQR
jgi:hypothetical protein